MYLLPEIANYDNTTEAALNKIKEILDKLCIIHKLLEKRGNVVTLDIVANSNTWSNQRRKRRLQQRVGDHAKVPKLDTEKDNTVKSSDTGNQVDNVSNSSIVPVSPKVDESYSSLEQLYENDHDVQLDGTGGQTSENKPLVRAFFKLIKKENNFLLGVEYLSGNAGKEGLHQIVQYIKNNWT